MNASSIGHDMRLRVGALVFTCFLLGSTGWISWLYHIMDMASPSMVDLYTMVLGYVMQAIGIGVYMVVRHKTSTTMAANVTIATLVAYVLLLEPATMSSTLAPTLIFGYTMNLMCGFTQGHYLSCLAELVEHKNRGTVFGLAYAVSTIVTWLISSMGSGFAQESYTTLVCVVLALLAIPCVRLALPKGVSEDEDSESHDAALPRQLIFLAGAAVVMTSLVKNAGFSFPAADLPEVLNLELSRLFYGVGLAMAGIVADRDRRLVLACCAVSLVTPFFMLALSSAGASSIVIWALGYLLFGFFSVFRVVLFADIAAQSGRIWLAGAGLLFGRIGDALGTALCLTLEGSTLALISVTAVLFVAAAGLLILLFVRIYGLESGLRAHTAADTADPLDAFCARYDLSEREREVLELLVRKMTNVRIAEELYISEATVKYHVRNILKKTGCANRGEVIALYHAA